MIWILWLNAALVPLDATLFATTGDPFYAVCALASAAAAALLWAIA